MRWGGIWELGRCLRVEERCGDSVDKTGELSEGYIAACFHLQVFIHGREEGLYTKLACTLQANIGFIAQPCPLLIRCLVKRRRTRQPILT